MDFTASIAATSMRYSQASLQQNVSIALLDKVMDTQQQAATELISQMQTMTPPSMQLLDVYA